MLQVPGAAGQLSRDGRRLSTQRGGQLTLWQLEPGLEHRTLPRYCFLERIGLDRDVKTLAVADLYAGCHILDLQNPLLRERLVRHLRGTWAAVTPDGQRVITSTENGSGIKVWDTETGQEIRDLVPASGPAAVTLSRDGRWLATSTSTEYAVWSVRTWEQILRIPREQSFEVGSAVFSPDGSLLAVTLAPSMVDLVEPKTGRQLARLQALENGWLSLVGFSPDGSASRRNC